jgi:hypothetical protein
MGHTDEQNPAPFGNGKKTKHSKYRHYNGINHLPTGVGFRNHPVWRPGFNGV